MAFTEEPQVIKGADPEAVFRRSIYTEIIKIFENAELEGKLTRFFILDNFGLDLAVFIRFQDSCTVRFLELKVFVGSRQGGVGFGNSRGEGPQVDLLLLDSGQLESANHWMRWIFMDGTMPRGSERFAFYDNEKAKESAMGGVKRNKQNNFRVNSLLQEAFKWDELSKKIEQFLISE